MKHYIIRAQKKKDINLIDELNNLNVSKSIFTYNKEFFIEITSSNIVEGINKITLCNTNKYPDLNNANRKYYKNLSLIKYEGGV